ncbi:MAG: hypothetical protein KKE44_22745 [Proteobacteria bacterium]|nr:hypothetical protein [Pseudomonadota bacterium]MBU1585552.1 hypothetical protein [Pseudomonadota bacterium]MBU2452760.1 hypothetical protein [Pseudomonadota bacterium]MBU2631425.1 hypothetical protein [Pseudomonadota bacterium]
MEVICKQSPHRLSYEETKTISQEEKIIVCSYCNNPITDPSKQLIVNNSFRHIFANPHGYVFEIGCFSEAGGCTKASDSSSEFSWFAGFSWQIGICNACSTHLGWVFASDAKRFYGLILEKLIFP